MKLTLINISWSAASQAAKLPRNPSPKPRNLALVRFVSGLAFYASKLCLFPAKTLHFGNFEYPSGNNGFWVEMKLTLIDISWSAASPAAKLPRNPRASNDSNEYLECTPCDGCVLTHLRSCADAFMTHAHWAEIRLPRCSARVRLKDTKERPLVKLCTRRVVGFLFYYNSTVRWRCCPAGSTSMSDLCWKPSVSNRRR